MQEDFHFNITVSKKLLLTTKLLGETIPLGAFSRFFYGRRDIVQWIENPTPLPYLSLVPLSDFSVSGDENIISIFASGQTIRPVACFNAAVITLSSLTDWLSSPRSFQQILNQSGREFANSLEYNKIKYFLLSSPRPSED